MNHFQRKRFLQYSKRRKKRQLEASLKYKMEPVMPLKELCLANLREINIIKEQENMKLIYQNYENEFQKKLNELELHHENLSNWNKKIHDQRLSIWMQHLSRKFTNFSKKLSLYDPETSNPILDPQKLLKGICSFFIKTGSCQYGSNCEKFHPSFYDNDLMKFNVCQQDIPEESKIILILKGIYNPQVREEFPDYEDFYHDVFRFISKKYGPLLGMRTCKNLKPHLYANVYLEFPNLTSAELGYHGLKHKTYVGALIIPELVILKHGWKMAICGLDHRNKCPKGDESCNYLHVYLNPGESKADLCHALLKNICTNKSDKRLQMRKFQDPNKEIEKGSLMI